MFDNIKLLSVIGDNNIHNLLPYFIEYYLGLGIKKENFYLTLNLTGNDVFDNYTEKILFIYDIPCKFKWRTNIHFGKEKFFYLKKMREEFICEKDWILRTDLDEFSEYPIGIKNVIRNCEIMGFDYIMGEWIDRISIDGQFIKIDKSKTLFEQFPIKTRISRKIFEKEEGQTSKVLLSKGFIETTNCGFHHVSNNNVKKSKEILDINHFKWDISVIEKMKNRANFCYCRPGKREGNTFLKYCEKNNYKINLNEDIY